MTNSEPPMTADSTDRAYAVALHLMACEDNPAHDEWAGCATTGPCAGEGRRLAAHLDATGPARDEGARAVRFRVEVACDGYSALMESDVPEDYDTTDYIAGAHDAAEAIRAALSPAALAASPAPGGDELQTRVAAVIAEGYDVLAAPDDQALLVDDLIAALADTHRIAASPAPGGDTGFAALSPPVRDEGNDRG